MVEKTRTPTSAPIETPPIIVTAVLDVPEAASHVAFVRKAARDLLGQRGVGVGYE
jgi:hypothetical protein